MKIVLVGASGFANFYIDYFRDFLGENELAAVIDPFASKGLEEKVKTGLSPQMEWIVNNRIKIYNTLEEFYSLGYHSDLVIICSPTYCHRNQAEVAMKNGSAVLCEKPLCATTKDAYEVKKMQEATGVPFGVGFQWSFSKAMQELKKDILRDKFGNPLELKTIISAKRSNKYYDPNGWKGKRTDKNGNIIMDSIAINATSHYLHNMLFILGDEMDKAKCPDKLSAALFRGRDIETYDTCFLQGEFLGGATIRFVASHVAEKEIFPKFKYKFEKGTVTYDWSKSKQVFAKFNDGTEKDYGSPDDGGRAKITEMLAAVEKRKKVVCGIDTIIPHLLICDAMINNIDVTKFPEGLIIKEVHKGDESIYVDGLCEAMADFYENGEHSRKKWPSDMKVVNI